MTNAVAFCFGISTADWGQTIGHDAVIRPSLSLSVVIYSAYLFPFEKRMIACLSISDTWLLSISWSTPSRCSEYCPNNFPAEEPVFIEACVGCRQHLCFMTVERFLGEQGRGPEVLSYVQHFGFVH